MTLNQVSYTERHEANNFHRNLLTGHWTSRTFPSAVTIDTVTTVRSPHLCLLFKSLALHERVVQLRVGITDLLLTDEELESFRQAGNRSMPIRAQTSEPRQWQCCNDYMNFMSNHIPHGDSMTRNAMAPITSYNALCMYSRRKRLLTLQRWTQNYMAIIILNVIWYIIMHIGYVPFVWFKKIIFLRDH